MGAAQKLVAVATVPAEAKQLPQSGPKPSKAAPVAEKGESAPISPTQPDSRAAGAMQRPGPGIDWANAYLESLSRTGRVVLSAEAAGVHPVTVLRRRRSDSIFAKAEEEAKDVAQDKYEDEAVRRAVDGVEREWLDKKGRVRRREIVYSDSILLRLLGRRDPTWREKHEHTVGGAIGHFLTRADRQAALKDAEAATAEPV